MQHHNQGEKDPQQGVFFCLEKIILQRMLHSVRRTFQDPWAFLVPIIVTLYDSTEFQQQLCNENTILPQPP